MLFFFFYKASCILGGVGNIKQISLAKLVKKNGWERRLTNINRNEYGNNHRYTVHKILKIRIKLVN